MSSAPSWSGSSKAAAPCAISSSWPSSRELAREGLVAPDQVDAAPLGGGHQPRARVARHPVARPLLQRGDQRVLRQLLGHPYVVHQPGQSGDQPRRLDPPHRLHRTPAPGPGRPAGAGRACGGVVAVGCCHGPHHSSRGATAQSGRPARTVQPRPYAGSSTCRTSAAISHSSPWMARKRDAHCAASSTDFAWMMAYPPMTSLASANGPSSTVCFPPGLPDHGPLLRRRSPPVSSSTPALVISSSSLPHLRHQLLARPGGGGLRGVEPQQHHVAHRGVLFPSVRSRRGPSHRALTDASIGWRRDRHGGAIFFRRRAEAARPGGSDLRRPADVRDPGAVPRPGARPALTGVVDADAVIRARMASVPRAERERRARGAASGGGRLDAVQGRRGRADGAWRG